jgi:hypothetical protein
MPLGAASATHSLDQHHCTGMHQSPARPHTPGDISHRHTIPAGDPGHRARLPASARSRQPGFSQGQWCSSADRAARPDRAASIPVRSAEVSGAASELMPDRTAASPTAPVSCCPLRDRTIKPH